MVLWVHHSEGASREVRIFYVCKPYMYIQGVAPLVNLGTWERPSRRPPQRIFFRPGEQAHNSRAVRYLLGEDLHYGTARPPCPVVGPHI